MKSRYSSPPIDSLRFPSFLFILALGIVLFWRNTANSSLWESLAFTRAGFMPLTNTFSFTSPDAPWINHEWLSLFLLNRLSVLFRGSGFALLQFLCAAGLILICHHTLRKTVHSGFLRVLLLVLLMILVGTNDFHLSPIVFSWILFAYLTKRLRDSQPSLLFPLFTFILGCLWANLHGTFFLGQILLILAALSAAAEAVLSHSIIKRQYALTLLSAASGFFLGTLFTPYGLHNWSLIFQSAGFCRPPELTGNTPYGVIREFQHYIPFWLLAGGTTAGLLVFRTPRLFPLCALAVTAALSLAGQHFVPFFAITALLLASEATDAFLGSALDRLIHPYAVIPLKIALSVATLMLALTGVLRAAGQATSIHVQDSRFPMAAIEFLDRNGMEAKALTAPDWGGFVLARLYPKVSVFLDTRLFAAYPAAVIQNYMDFISARNVRALRAYPVDLVLLPPKSSAARLMHEQKNWTDIYEDETAVIFIKNDIHADILRKHGLNALYMPENKGNVSP